MLYLQAAREYLPAAQANFVRVVINGEHWGIYSNVEQVNKNFLQEWFKTEDGTRWKVPGSPGGRGGLEYWGDDVARIQAHVRDQEQGRPEGVGTRSSTSRRCSTRRRPTKLEAALAPILDIDRRAPVPRARQHARQQRRLLGAGERLQHLPGSRPGKFHILPHDTNETFGPGGRGPGGPGGSGGPGGPAAPVGLAEAGPADLVDSARRLGCRRWARRVGPGSGGPVVRRPWRSRGFMMGGDATLDLLIGLDDASKPLRSKLLAVPALRAKYLAYTQGHRDEVARLEHARSARDADSRRHRGRREESTRGSS